MIPMNIVDYKEEYNTITDIANENGYTKNEIDRINNRIKHKIQQKLYTTFYTIEEEPKKYIPVQYNEYTSKIMQKILKSYGYNTAYVTNNKIQQILRPKNEKECDSGIYKLVCNDCPCYYIGQTGRNFKQRFSEHITETKQKHKTTFNSNFAQHIVTEKHTITDSNTNLKVLYKLNKGDMMNRLEEYEIYKHRNDTLLLNDKINTRTNKLYDIIQNNER